MPAGQHAVRPLRPRCQTGQGPPAPGPGPRPPAPGPPSLNMISRMNLLSVSIRTEHQGVCVDTRLAVGWGWGDTRLGGGGGGGTQPAALTSHSPLRDDETLRVNSTTESHLIFLSYCLFLDATTRRSTGVIGRHVMSSLSLVPFFQLLKHSFQNRACFYQNTTHNQHNHTHKHLRPFAK